MIGYILKKISGRHYRKFVQKCRPVVERINALEQEYQQLSEEALRAKTDEFRARLKNGETTDALLPEAFAVVKNAARRLCGRTEIVCEHELTWNMVHFDVQLIGGMALHQGKIAEMATGEGKTLVATLPLYLNALTGRNAQLVTVNDYLARRDSQWMGFLFKYLGLTVGCIQNHMNPVERRAAYGCDITYGTASEFGFDYLRDNGMATSKEQQVQREHFFCIVDEIDSILIDEARTPLIISGPMAIQREQPYPRLKASVERLVSEQGRLCNRLVGEAKALLEKTDATADDRAEAVHKLLQVKTGSPKNKQLLRLMETPEWRKLLDKAETEMASDFNKEASFRMKEELYFVIDERQHQADLTEKGRTLLKPDDPDAFMLPDLPTLFSDLERETGLSPEDKEARKREAQARFETVGEDIHAISQLLRAYSLYERDVQYVVTPEGKVAIVDENTGRIMPGRRWSDGLHAAVEAKENVQIERETRTYATITIQNYFRMYDKLAGMTGTAETEATEFHEIYKLGVTVIPTNRPCVRIDNNDVIYKTRRSKFNAVVKEIEEAHKRGQPVLVGTASVESSEILSRMLRRVSIPHAVLNAKYHQQEADIVTRAGQRGAVTIATNMAGRGTDIKLGEGVDALGGLYVIGTERHESRRIDRQLRGRCARQGDPGLSKFYISLEDDLMRLFASAGPLARIMEKSMMEDEELAHPLLNRSIESAQKKVEQQNFSIRKRLLQYDDVLNKQREIVYSIRNDALHSDEPRAVIFDLVEEEMSSRLESAGFGAKEGPVAQSLESFIGWLNSHFPVGLRLEDLQKLDLDAAKTLVMERVRQAYALKENAENRDALTHLERYLLTNAVDNHWQEHLTEMEDLRKSITLRSYGQKDPLVEYKSEAFRYFQELMDNIRLQVCTSLFRSATNLIALENIKIMLARSARLEGPGVAQQSPTRTASSGGAAVSSSMSMGGGGGTALAQDGEPPAAGRREIKLPQITIKRDIPKVGRNDPCPCGSGKKYKNCCGK
ncbi:preprotein translocase subunit SecA [Opitutales bacterium ASA1]|uniref:preprotein translocase subunit SecA n=1 Tax=Congregicoccus parvus TaxID=3081749 RepID=UPI002B2C2153|nr:preprotein translocase subunit SecA [Opitutales bacterium ASA1]